MKLILTGLIAPPTTAAAFAAVYKHYSDQTGYEIDIPANMCHDPYKEWAPRGDPVSAQQWRIMLQIQLRSFEGEHHFANRSKLTVLYHIRRYNLPEALLSRAKRPMPTAEQIHLAGDLMPEHKGLAHREVTSSIVSRLRAARPADRPGRRGSARRAPRRYRRHARAPRPDA
jgi:hypothetical protein